MMHISYAQNLEDYHLDLVFAGQPNGTYVDVGGGHPVADNVSFWFYLKGWRGLVVEPQRALADIYADVRPRDHTVSCLAGRAHGEAEFHVVDTLHGFSTTVKEHAAGAAKFGAGYKTIRKPVRTLTELCAEAGLGKIDFLKIDVEGAEADVLAGMDFALFRPRVVMIEAIAPGSMEAAKAGPYSPETAGALIGSVIGRASCREGVGAAV
jgi:FkbM family methyltransferase